MKKLVLLLSVAFLAACGGGGTKTTATTTAQGSGDTGTLVIKINEAASKTAPVATPTVIHMRRIVATNPAIKDDQGKLIQFTVADYVVGGATPSITLPVGTGYVVEVLDYDITGTAFSAYTTVGGNGGYDGGPFPFRLISTAHPATSTIKKPYVVVKYGKTTDVGGVAIAKGAATSITITVGSVAKPTVAIGGGFGNISTAVGGGKTYKVAATFPAITPFDQSSWAFRGSYDVASAPTGSILQVVSGGTTSASQPSPTLFNQGVMMSNYSLVGEFSLNASLRKATDTGADFVVQSQTTTVLLKSDAGSVTFPAASF